jgi:hypothetical protein
MKFLLRKTGFIGDIESIACLQKNKVHPGVYLPGEKNKPGISIPVPQALFI